MSDSYHSGQDKTRRLNLRWTATIGVSLAFVLFLILLIITGQTWRAIAYAIIVLFAFLFLQALYFWGAMLLGGTLDALTQKREPVPWTIDDGSGLAAVEHDLDPGLELLAAGILVYRPGEVKPQVHFRQVPLDGIRAIRPFVAARTGDERMCHFRFLLTDEQDSTQFDKEISYPVENTPQIVMPPYRLLISMPRKLNNSRWSLQVRSGATVVTTFRFRFVDAVDTAEHQDDWLPSLLDDALKRDVMSTTQEIMLEDL